MGYKITLIPGDGIGPEIVREARKVLDAVGKNMVMNLIILKFYGWMFYRCLWCASHRRSS